MSYDRALTIYSPNGHLFQVEYAQSAVERGASVIGVKSPEAVVLCVEKRSTAKLQDTRTMQKIAKLDDHIMVAFAGLTADARVLINQARIQCQVHRLNLEDAISVEGLARWMAQKQQKYTQRGGVRPFGVTSLIAGFDSDGVPKLFKTDPSGAFSSWKAATTGKNSKFIQEFLEKNFKENMSKDEAVSLALEALLEVVDQGKGNIEVVVVTPNAPAQFLGDDEIDQVVKDIEKRKAEDAEKKKKSATESSG